MLSRLETASRSMHEAQPTSTILWIAAGKHHQFDYETVSVFPPLIAALLMAMCVNTALAQSVELLVD